MPESKRQEQSQRGEGPYRNFINGMKGYLERGGVRIETVLGLEKRPGMLSGKEGVNFLGGICQQVDDLITQEYLDKGKPPPEFKKAIEEKQIQEQVAEKKKYELLQAQKNAEIAIANAKGRGDASREKAKGEADATRTRGEADAAYNAKVSTSLTPLLVQNRYVSQWDGQLPQYMLGGGSGVLLQLPGGDARK